MSLIKHAEDVIFSRRQKAEAVAENNYKIARKNEEFLASEKEYLALMLKSAKEEAFNKALPETVEALKNAEEKKAKILSKLKLSSTSFLPNYFCKVCDDKAYINGVACICLKQEINNFISEQYGIPAQQLKSFEESDLSQNPLLKECLSDKYSTMQRYSESFPDNKFRTLIFSGPSGTGKTRLAMCMAQRIKARGFTVIIMPAFKLNEVFLKYHTDFKGDGRTYLDNLANCDLLIIDDLGTENTLKNVTNEYLLQIMSDRMMSNKHTIISTNLNSEQIIQKYGDRMHSRFTDKKQAYTFIFNSCDLRQITK